MSDYYSRRNRPFTKEVTSEFWNALKAYVGELSDMDWLFEQFGVEAYDFGNEYRYVDKEKVNRKMLQEIGRALYPLPDNRVKDDTVFDLIEFFYRFISIPGKDKFDDFDNGTARYQYTVRINQLFENFKLSYKLEKGVVKERHSGVIDRSIIKDDFVITDSDTQTLIGLALEKFYSRKHDERSIGLEKLVDAFQRVSSWESKDKSKSISSILDRVSKDLPATREPLEEELKTLWQLANKFMIRHAELDKVKITDIDFLEYLFYRYYSVLRLVFKKYDFSKKPQEEMVSVDDEDEFIPELED